MAGRIVLKSRGKYGNRAVVSGGVRFASAREHRRWLELTALEAAGAISCLRRQVPFDLVANGVTVCRYVADATYYEGGEYVVEDSKGYRTREYKLKRKLMLALHGITVRET
jgi:hypothetical protein